MSTLSIKSDDETAKNLEFVQEQLRRLIAEEESQKQKDEEKPEETKKENTEQN
jgi:hypothetical protein